MNTAKFRVFRVDRSWVVRGPGCTNASSNRHCLHRRCGDFTHWDDAMDFAQRHAAAFAFFNPRWIYGRKHTKDAYALA